MRMFDQIVALYWGIGAAKVVEKKIGEEERYKNRLREAFGKQSLGVEAERTCM